MLRMTGPSRHIVKCINVMTSGLEALPVVSILHRGRFVSQENHISGLPEGESSSMFAAEGDYSLQSMGLMQTTAMGS